MTAHVCVTCGGSLAAVNPRRNTCSASCDLAKRKATTAAYRARVRAREKTPPPYSKCDGCRQMLAAGAFQKNRARVSGLQNYCRECRAAYDHRPDQAAKNRLRKHVWYLIHWEEERQKRRERLLFDREFRARVYAANHARYHADPKGVYQRWKERQALARAWEAAEGPRCFCGRALPEGRYFCRPACKSQCSRFVCGLSLRAAPGSTLRAMREGGRS